jgi:hypothetical protein
VEKRGIIFDPCCGKGSLLKPWKKTGYITWGITELKDWKLLVKWKVTLILCNPPFNSHGNKLGSEFWLDQIIERFGKDIPIVLFTPMGFRLNGQQKGNQKYPPISSIISLPLGIFPEVEFHSEILIFNLPNLSPHYFFNHPI